MNHVSNYFQLYTMTQNSFHVLFVTRKHLNHTSVPCQPTHPPSTHSSAVQPLIHLPPTHLLSAFRLSLMLFKHIFLRCDVSNHPTSSSTICPYEFLKFWLISCLSRGSRNCVPYKLPLSKSKKDSRQLVQN